MFEVTRRGANRELTIFLWGEIIASVTDEQAQELIALLQDEVESEERDDQSLYGMLVSAWDRDAVVVPKQIDPAALRTHVESCPLGWHGDQVLQIKSASNEDVIQWLSTLREMAGAQ